MTDEQRLQRLLARFANAKRRARYWSGTPDFREGQRCSMTPLARRRRAARGTDHELEYETAVTDCQCLADAISKLTGHRPKVPDYRRDLADRFALGLGQILGRQKG